MLLEEIEFNDWKILPSDNNNDRFKKSVEAYWLNNWYDQMKDITPKTFIYTHLDEIPDILPFDKCMVRYENKSPKDSEFWGSISTKEELIKIFYTSLRCKTNQGKYYCVREWINLADSEYRCFWNNGLVAISSESNYEPPINEILEYINNIKNKIIYNRCVFDIAHMYDSNKINNLGDLMFIEYNSWESNSGAHRFNWYENTEELYNSTNEITIKWLNGEKKINQSITNLNRINYTNYLLDNEMLSLLYKNKILKPIKPTNYLITEKYVYITNDIWLGRFDLNLKPLNWKRGVFRFGNLELCTDGCIFDGTNYYYYDLTPKNTKSLIKNKSKINIFLELDDLVLNNKINLINQKYKYGIILCDIQTFEIKYLRVDSNMNFHVVTKI